jgi:signal recognition particle receptor subunit beta
MALFNHVIREVNAKIVYFGPGFSGKETSVTHIYRKLNPEFRSPLKAMTVQGNRMLFFDFRPTEKGVEGYSVRFHLYTVVEEVLKPSTWKMVLKGADGVVFVADSDPTRQQENLDRLHEVQTLLAAEGSGIDQIPFVIQYNRRDISGAVELEEMQRRLNRDNAPGFPSTATTGDGVLPPLSSLIKMVLAKIRASLESEARGESDVVAAPEVAPEAKVVAPALLPESAEITTPVDPTLPAEEPARCEKVAPDEEVAVRAEEISLEIAGGGCVADGRLTVPLTVSAGALRREFRLVISLTGVESRER